MSLAQSSPIHCLSSAVSGLAALALTLTFTMVGAELPDEQAEGARAAPLVMQSLLLDGDARGDHMIVVGERGHILISHDAGASWTQAEVPTRATLTAVTLHDANLGFAVGHDAVILRTQDGGRTWALVYAAPEEERPLLDVWFEDALHGFAIGAYGFFLETRDGGDTWRARRIADGDPHFNQIAAAPSGRLYIAAESGRLYRSDDRGETWKTLDSPYQGSFFGTLPMDHRRVYLFGLRGRLFHSDDAGAHWSEVDTRTEHMLTNAIALEEQAFLVTGMGGTLLLGDDVTRTVKRFARLDRRGIAGALDAGDGSFVVFGEFGVERMSRRHFESPE